MTPLFAGTERVGVAAGVVRQPAALPRHCRVAGARLLLWTAVAALANAAVPVVLTGRLFWRQDVAWLLATGLLLILCGWVRLPTLPAPLAAWCGRRPRLSLGALLGCAALAMLATYALTGGFHLSRDEIMADFDATIFRSGRLIAALPPAWRGLSKALVPNYLLPVPGSAGLVSSYLPGNAALRALVGLVASPDCTGPLLAGLAILALYRIGRRLWPDRPEQAAIAVLMLATSSQVLVTATTSFAMTAHLAVNLVWLWLFLRDDRIGHAGAMATGFLSCGLHQLIFHPLFAAPFILRLWTRRRWRLAAAYTAAYAVFAAAWISYPLLVRATLGVAGTGSAGAPHFFALVVQLVAGFSLPTNTLLMLDNVLRCIAWQHVLLLPLLLAAWGAVRRDEGLARPLLAGVALTLLVPFLLVPWQGNGWGYRYLHGVLGSLALLAAYGWAAATAGLSHERRHAARSILAVSTAATLLAVLPAHIRQVHAMERPYRAALRAIRQAPAELVFVDPSGMEFANDLVRNDPFLRNRPRVLSLEYLDRPAIESLCARFSVAVFDARLGDALGMPRLPGYLPDPYPGMAWRRALMQHLGCGRALSLATPRRAEHPQP